MSLDLRLDWTQDLKLASNLPQQNFEAALADLRLGLESDSSHDLDLDLDLDLDS